jgi:tRNA-dihydrouridine synthase
VEYRDRYGVDGIMIGRASIGHPWIFNEIKHFIATGQHLAPPTVADRVDAARQHLRSSLAWKGPWEGVVEMRRHYGNYLKGLPNVKEVRLRLCTERDPAVLEEILDEVVANYSMAEVA